MNNILIKNWNMLDTFIYKVEKCISQIKNKLKNSQDEIPDPEEMIEAATERLQQENEQLKKKQYPGRIIMKGNNYYCPDCYEHLSQDMIKKKFCSECGKRIVLEKNLYATSHK